MNKKMSRLVVAFVSYILVSVWIVNSGVAESLARPDTLTTTTSVYVWNQRPTGDWQLPSNWTPERTNPASTDVLVFNFGGTTTVTNVPTQSIGQLIISGNTTVNFESATPAALTILGGDDVDLPIASGSALNFGGLNAITTNVASGATGIVLGSVTFSSPASSAHRLTAVDTNAITFGNGARFTAGQGFIGNAFGTANLNSIVFESGSTYVRLAGDDPFGAVEPSSVVVFKAGSLFSLRAPTLFAQSSFYSGRTYANFEYNNPGHSDIQGASALVMDDLTVRAGHLDFGVNGSPGHSIKGNITVFANSSLGFQSSFPGHTINLNGNAPQTLTNRGSVGVNPGNTLAIDNAFGVTVNSRFIAGNLQLINGVVTVTNPFDYFRVPGEITRVNGYIEGGISREVDLTGTYRFDVGTANGYSPVDVQVTAGHDFPAVMLIRAVQTAQPNILYPSQALSRYWQVYGGPNIDSANLTFHYFDPSDIPSTANESNFVIQRYRNGFSQPTGVIDTQANTFNLMGLNDFLAFTDWTLAEPAAAVTPTATSTPTASPTSTATPICPPVVLYDQSGSVGTQGINSQDFDTANDAFDSQAADDFVVPEGQTWTLQKVVVDGSYFNGAGPANSFNVTFYTDVSLFPGSAVAGGAFTGAGYNNAAGVFTITLPSSLVLGAGTYWVAVQARMDGVPGGQWAWSDRTVTTNSQAVWRNPGGGFNIPACVDWARRGATCMIDPAEPDQVFQLIGTIGTCATPTATVTNTATPTATATGTPSGRTAFDYDGDRKADISVFRLTDGAWYLQQSQAGLFGTLFGFGSDRITPADYDGDGKTDIAVYRPSTGICYVFNSSNGTVSYYVFGLAEDLPTPADYDGDGKADVSVFRPSTGTWYRQNSSDGSYSGIQFGASEDKPTIGDFDGDGKSDITVFRPSTGAWYRINSGDGSIYGELFGFGTDIITPADYDGDGKTDLAAYRPTDGIWYLKYSSNSSYDYKVFGLSSDIPAPADFDGDGKADICVFRPSDGNWYRQNSSNGAFTAFQFGASGDKPTMTAFRY